MNQTTLPSFELNSEPVSELLKLFQEKSAELRFPDVDADQLGQAMAAVEAQREKVDEALAALGDAKDALVQLEDSLMKSVQKAHAYVSVFAAGNEELEAQVAQINFVAPGRTGRKKRPTPKKAKTSSPEAPPADADVTESDAEVDPVAAE